MSPLTLAFFISKVLEPEMFKLRSGAGSSLKGSGNGAGAGVDSTAGEAAGTLPGDPEGATAGIGSTAAELEEAPGKALVVEAAEVSSGSMMAKDTDPNPSGIGVSGEVKP